MNFKLKAFVLALFITLPLLTQAQVHVGIYHSATTGQIGVGTNNEKKIFGELRLFATDRLNLDFGLEVIGNYNFSTSETLNIHGGLMLGYYGVEAVGIPLGITIKPFQELRNFGILLEATPYVLGGSFYFRSNLGLRYRFNKKE
jgi:xanthine/uracil/vitamin C permease (AzgA family)